MIFWQISRIVRTRELLAHKHVRWRLVTKYWYASFASLHLPFAWQPLIHALGPRITWTLQTSWKPVLAISMFWTSTLCGSARSPASNSFVEGATHEIVWNLLWPRPATEQQSPENPEDCRKWSKIFGPKTKKVPFCAYLSPLFPVFYPFSFLKVWVFLPCVWLRLSQC